MTRASAPRTSPSRPRDEARALFRNAILEAAEHVFAERGFHAARIQDIAERARIAVGTVYNHFPQKEDLLRGLLEERTREMIAEFEPHDDDPPGFELRLTRRVARLLKFVERHDKFFAIANEHGLMGSCSAASALTLGNQGMNQVELFRSAVGAVVDEGLEHGALEPLGRTQLARFFGSLIRSFTIGAFDKERDGRLEDEAPVLVELFLRGAARRPPAGSTP